MPKHILTASTFGLSPERAARRKAAESRIMAVFAQYGYEEVSLPLYEYYEVLRDITHDFRDENVICFTERSGGKTLVLRPDFTPQVCRMVAGYKGELPLPLRVYYRGSIFRNVDTDQGTKSEKYQIGCELYGTKEIAGDLELILCANRIMQSSKINEYRIIFGDAGYISRLFALLGDAPAREYRKILAEKAIYKLDEFTSRLDAPALAALIKALPLAFGGRDEIKELIALSAFDEELKTRANYLQEFFQNAVRCGVAVDKIVYDPSEARGLGYYTGINFEILNSATGASFGGGGRYDKLMAKFGVDYTACGMALYLSEIEAASAEALPEPDIDLVIGSANMAKAEELRNAGHMVVQLFDGDDKDAFLAGAGRKFNIVS
ncbi:MAG: ATP phosphoribosyltransferase regulatory subunit [Deferribacteraceae bacterium]|nr:ATP phosphoribosyltransferase regulatory subunit [Deferribacteraceae bacterium]